MPNYFQKIKKILTISTYNYIHNKTECGDVIVADEEQRGQNKGHLTDAFTSVTEILNKEIAAMTGEVNLDNPGVLAGGVRSVLGVTSTKMEIIKEKKRSKDFFDLILYQFHSEGHCAFKCNYCHPSGAHGGSS